MQKLGLSKINVRKINTAYWKFHVVTVWYLLICYTSSFGQKSYWYDFKGNANLEINYANNPGKKVLSLFANKMFPDQEIRLNDTITAGSGHRSYMFSAVWPQKVILTTADKSVTLLLTPGSTLVCNLDFKDLTKITFTAPDSLAAINEYLFKKDFSVKIPLKKRRSMAVQSAETLEVFSAKMNELYLEELEFYNENIVNLPKCYQSYEYWQNRYSDATERLNAIIQRSFSQKTKEPIPPKYYSFLDSLAVNNDSAKNSYSYYLFLYELFNKRLNENDLAHQTKSNFLDYQIELANIELSGDAQDLFKSFIIQLVYNHFKKDVAKNYIKNNDSIFSNTIWLNELKEYFKSKDIHADKGKTPPNFHLVDSKDSVTILKSFQGNVIVLSFWFAGCKPCIKEFPFENALMTKFKDKPVKIVSVCVNTTEEIWKQWSQRFRLETINLWANSAWEKTIIEKYDLTIFPKYVLIDKDYLIAETDAERPSQGLETQINFLLEK